MSTSSKCCRVPRKKNDYPKLWVGMVPGKNHYREHCGGSLKMKLQCPQDQQSNSWERTWRKPKGKRHMHPNVIAVILSIAKKPTNCPSADECIKEDAVHVHKGTLLSHKQENNNATCNNSGGPGDDHTVGCRLKTDSNISCSAGIKKWVDTP